MVHMKRKILFLKDPARPIEINLAGSFLWVQKDLWTCRNKCKYLIIVWVPNSCDLNSSVRGLVSSSR